MRIFIEIDLPNEIKDYLFNIQKQISNKSAKITWVAKKYLHLNLKFIGEISEDKFNILKEKLKEIDFNKFKVNLDKIGFFPEEDNIRIIWIGLKPEQNIIKLQQKIDESLLSLFHQDQRFKSHLTLGRVKFVKNKKDFIEKFKKIQVNNLEFEINEFKLMKSTLTKDGPIYEVLEVYKLE